MNSREHIKSKLEYLKRYEPSLSFDIDMYKTIKQDLDRLEKLEKAIEILKDKLDIDILTNGNVDNYYKYYLDFRSSTNTRTFVSITQEQYELLKEVLENE